MFNTAIFIPKHKPLFVEILLERFHFPFTQDTSFEPSSEESGSVTYQLDKGGNDAEATDFEGILEGILMENVLRERIRKNQKCIKGERKKEPPPEERKENKKDYSDGENGGKKMDEFQGFGILLEKIDPRYSGIVYLLEELPEISPSLVIHPRLREKPAFVSSLENPYAEIYVLAEPHCGESSQCGVHVPPDTHVEAAWIELVHFDFPAAYSTCREERCHGIADGLLHGSEAVVGPVRTAESVRTGTGEFLLDLEEISRRNDHVRIQNYEIFAFRPLGSEVP